ALINGDVMRKMLTDEEHGAVCRLFNDGLMNRLARETINARGIEGLSDTFGWIRRLNSVGTLNPFLGELFGEWWSCNTAGTAAAFIKYISVIAYEDYNVIFNETNRFYELYESDSSLPDGGWEKVNVEALAAVLAPRKVHQALEHVVQAYEDEEELCTAA